MTNLVIGQPSKPPPQTPPKAYPHQSPTFKTPNGGYYQVNPNGGPLPPPPQTPIGGYLILLVTALVYGFGKQFFSTNTDNRKEKDYK